MLNKFIKMPLEIEEFTGNIYDKTSFEGDLFVNLNSINYIKNKDNYLYIILNDSPASFRIKNTTTQEFMDYINKQIHNGNFNQQIDSVIKE